MNYFQVNDCRRLHSQLALLLVVAAHARQQFATQSVGAFGEGAVQLIAVHFEHADAQHLDHVVVDLVHQPTVLAHFSGVLVECVRLPQEGFNVFLGLARDKMVVLVVGFGMFLRSRAFHLYQLAHFGLVSFDDLLKNYWMQLCFPAASL